jgi:hypothetical protein
MPIATLRFKLPEEEHEYRRAMMGSAALSLLWDIDQHLRGLIKHGTISAETQEELQRVRNMIHEDPDVQIDC